MPFAYPHRAHLKVDILARVAAGERLMALCAAPGMPSFASVLAWARGDPAFAAELRQARRVAEWRRRYAFDEVKAKALIARLAAGEGIVSALRAPDMPSRRVYAYWRATQGEFQAQVNQVNQLRAENRRFRNKARFRPFDPAVADRILVRVLRGDPISQVRRDPALASGALITRWRRENPEFDRLLTGALAIGGRNRRRRQPRATRCTEALIEAIMERIIHGDTLASLGRAPDMPCAATLYAWKRTNPEFARALAIARMGREDLRDDKRLLAAQAAHARGCGVPTAAVALARKLWSPDAVRGGEV